MLTFDTSSRGQRFSSVTQMNDTMIRNWNSVVDHGDKVYHLGDVIFGERKDTPYILSQLNGRKRLILGNHDDGKNPYLHRFFEKIMVSRVFKDNGMLLTHIPVHPDSLHENKYPVCVHGHIHDLVIPDKRYKNVSVEQIDYTPREITNI
jgi:calcineurin-like phosphoesterase family protein